MRKFGLLLMVGLVAGPALSGCSSEDEACLREDDGNLLLSTDRLVLTAPDSVSNIKTTVADAVLGDILDFTSGVPRRIIYRFTAPARPSFDVILEYIGYTLPVTEGETYTLYLERNRITPASTALSISDSLGIRYLGVNDWKPNWGVLEGGYPELGTDGQLRVAFSDPGCDPRLENTTCYRSITNYRLDFTIGTGSALGLRNGESGKLGNWIFKTHKAELIVAKACGLLDANGVSFSVERSGLR